MVRAAFLFKSSRINYFNLEFIQDLTCVVFSSYQLSQFFACYSQLSPDWTRWPAKSCKPSQTHNCRHHTITKGQKATPYKKRDSTQFFNRLGFTNLSQLLRQNLMLGGVPLAHTISDVPRSWLGCWLSLLLPPAWHKATHPTSWPCCREYCRSSGQPNGIENALNSHILSVSLAMVII